MRRIHETSASNIATARIVLISLAMLAIILIGLSQRPGASASLNQFLPSPSPTPQDQDDDVVRVSTDLVVINATVLNRDGKFANGLKRADFKLYEDGIEQKISTFSAEETPFAAAVLLDTSGSMESRLTLGRSAAIRFLDGLRDEDVAAVYNFDVK